MVETVRDRLKRVFGADHTVVQLSELLGVSYQAATKVYNGKGISIETAQRVAEKKPGLSPMWLMSGKGEPFAPSPPPAPSEPNGEAFKAPTPEELAFLNDYRVLLDADREHYRREIAAKAKQMNEHMARLMGNIKGKEKP